MSNIQEVRLSGGGGGGGVICPPQDNIIINNKHYKRNTTLFFQHRHPVQGLLGTESNLEQIANWNIIRFIYCL